MSELNLPGLPARLPRLWVLTEEIEGIVRGGGLGQKIWRMERCNDGLHIRGTSSTVQGICFHKGTHAVSQGGNAWPISSRTERPNP
jgi:hypothetical protein